MCYIQNGQKMFGMLFSIYYLLKYAPNYMLHINQFWCTLWCDSANLIILISKVENNDS